MNRPAHKTDQSKRPKNECFSTLVFTGKEKDSETGYYNFGARYYDSDLSGLFLSVDPMADKYPSLSPYAYCAWNPVRLVDPKGNWPWEPKHIREARRFARRNDGSINIQCKSNGLKIANVGYKSTTSEFGEVFTLRSFYPEDYNSRGSINQTTGIAALELWMDEPGNNIFDFGLKGVCSTVYSFINEPYELLTGLTLAGSHVNSEEKSLAAIDLLSLGFGSIIQKGAGIVKTKGETGLAKYNDFVGKSGGRNGRSQKEMGFLYQKNKQALENYSKGKISYNITTTGLSTINNSIDD